MRPIPHTQDTAGENTDERTRLTTRQQKTEVEPDDDETWLAVQEF